MTNSISRRAVAKGAAWAVPAVTIAGTMPAFAASTTCECPEYGNLIAVPWTEENRNYWQFNGTETRALKWGIYPTKAQCDSCSPYYGYTNLSNMKAEGGNTGLPPRTNGNDSIIHLGQNPASTNFPAYFPSNQYLNLWNQTISGDKYPDSPLGVRPNSIGAGSIINVKIERLDDNIVHYADSWIMHPTDEHRVKENTYGSWIGGTTTNRAINGEAGVGAQLPYVRINDDYMGATSNEYWSYLRMQNDPIPDDTDKSEWARTGTHTVVNGKDVFEFNIEVMHNIDDFRSGSHIVSFETRLRRSSRTQQRDREHRAPAKPDQLPPCCQSR